MVLALSLAGCSSGAHEYPSLAIRDAERVSGTFVVGDTLIEPAATSAEVIESLTGELAAARAGHSRFMQMSDEAERLALAARGADTDSNDWAVAQVALAQLESQRSQSAITLATLDLYYADASLDFTRREQIDDVRNQVLAIVRHEDEVLMRLRGIMPE